MKTFAGCTIVARNYRAQATVLATSFDLFQHDADFFTLVLDAVEHDDPIDGCGTVLTIEDLGVSDETLTDMLAIYDVMEFATAVKPLLLAALLRRGYAAAAYIDPDIQIFAHISDVLQDAADHGIVLTPHTVEPLPRDGKKVDEKTIMQAGIFNLGFIAVGSSALVFLDWWFDRLREDAIVDFENALFTDQRWIDWVPALFPHLIRRDKGLNVAYWNLHERPLSLDGGTLTAGGDPVRFIHFSGYKPNQPWLLSYFQGDRPRVLLSEQPVLRELCDDYGRALVAHGFNEETRVPYRYNTLATGIQMKRELRRLLRSQRKNQLPRLASIPNPYRAPGEFSSWICTRSFGTEGAPISPLELALWNDRPDLRAAFPWVEEGNTVGYRTWFSADPTAQAFIRSVLGERTLVESNFVTQDTSADDTGSSVGRHAFGWSVVAYAKAELGVGEAGRRLHSIVQRSGVPSELVGIDLTQSRQLHSVRTAVRSLPSFENALVAVNADQLYRVGPALGLEQLRRRTVGYWFWELEVMPNDYLDALNHVQEVWVATRFIQRAVQSMTDRPVRLVPLPITISDRPTHFTRAQVGMPDHAFVFLTNFDYLSSFQRKNPIGTIRAYREAFGPDDGAVLVVKSINGHLTPLQAERVKAEGAGRNDILFLDDYVSSAHMHAMIELADCYVSLHRSEGLGLNMSDAMARNTPVIATGYSGNLDFMTEETAALVPFTITEIGPDGGPYPANGRWASPDTEAASAWMRRLFDDRAVGEAMAERALGYVRENFSPEVCTNIITPLLLA